ncbi:MAG: TraB/GumN family protein [Pseudomonadales bacterium]
MQIGTKNMLKTVNKLVLASAALAAVLGAQSCATNPVTSMPLVQATTKPVEDVVSGDRPAMWRLADEDTEIFLFGTFHILPPGTDWTSAAMDAAMADTTTTYIEADGKSPQAQQELQQVMQQYGLNPAGVTLSSILGAERAAKFAVVAEQYGVPLANLEPLRPWLASMTLSLVAYQQAGFDFQSGAETTIIAKAKEQNDAMRNLETGVEQIKALASLDEIQDYTSFDEELAQLANLKEEIAPVVEAWRTGDLKTIEHSLVKMIRDVSPAAFDILLKNRNANWVRHITALMTGEGSYFIAVGAAHLVGKDSVVDMLREGGYVVMRVQ